jgi:hypothetical protein
MVTLGSAEDSKLMGVCDLRRIVVLLLLLDDVVVPPLLLLLPHLVRVGLVLLLLLY